MSKRWWFLWMFIPLSLDFTFPSSENQNGALDYWIHFSTQLATVKILHLHFSA